MKRSKGMTLVELLIAMGLSALIMASTFIIVQFSANTYDSTIKMVHDNNNSYDAVSIINSYIRSSYNCAVFGGGKNLYVTVSNDSSNYQSDEKKTISIAFDDSNETVFIDFLDGSEKIIVSEGVCDIAWEIKDGGVEYKAFGYDSNGNKVGIFSGYVYKRGQ